MVLQKPVPRVTFVALPGINSGSFPFFGRLILIFPLLLKFFLASSSCGFHEASPLPGLAVEVGEQS